MTHAADFIAALLGAEVGGDASRRSRDRGLNLSWRLWAKVQLQRRGLLKREQSEAVVQWFAQRPARQPEPIAPVMSRWRAARSLFYQQWDPPLREERRLRWFAGTVSVLLHLGFAFALILLALVQISIPPPVGEENRVQVELLGQGTPNEVQTEPTNAPATPPATTPEISTATDASASAAPTASTASEAVETPASVAQPVSVTETPTPTIEFVLPPTTIANKLPSLVFTPKTLTVPHRDVVVVDTPVVTAQIRTHEWAVPQIKAPDISVHQRDIPEPLSKVDTLRLPERTLPTPAATTATVAVPQRDIPLKAPVAAATPSPATLNTPSRASVQAPVQIPGQTSSTANAVVRDPRPLAAPASTVRGDDWGAANHNAPGATNGGKTSPLLNRDGSLHAPGNLTQAPTAAGPPGSKQQQQADNDRSGQWLQRVQYPYEPTMFDKYYKPNESLLEEWVRRNIREVEVPLPGSSKKIRCVVSLLQLGGGCFVSDPNLNEQPAVARPPPDIPLKRTPIPEGSR